MSMEPQPWPEPAPEVVRAVRAKHYGREVPLPVAVRDQFGELFADAEFAAAFGASGPKGWSPGRLGLVTVFQMAENLTDRQAAEAVRDRLSWAYALGLSLEDTGFDHTVLCEFRTRVVAHGLQERVLDLLLARLKEKGLVGAGGKQRTDSTGVISAVRDLNRLELAGESVRALVEALSSAAPHWLAQVIDVPGWSRRYGRRIDSWKLPTSATKRETLALDYARDGFALLEAVYAPGRPAWLRELPAAQVLRTVLLQNYTRSTASNGKVVVKRREKDTEHGGAGLPPGRWRLTSPYDTDARWSVKRERFWNGYKVHISETCATKADDAARPAPEPGTRAGSGPVPRPEGRPGTLAPEPDHQHRDHRFHRARQQSAGGHPPRPAAARPAARRALPGLRLPLRRADHRLGGPLRPGPDHSGAAEHLPPGPRASRLCRREVHHRLGGAAGHLPPGQNERLLEPV
jgi:transposase